MATPDKPRPRLDDQPKAYAPLRKRGSREPRKETGTLSHEPQGSQRQERTADRPPPKRLRLAAGPEPMPLSLPPVFVSLPPVPRGPVRLGSTLWRSGKAPRDTGSTPGGGRSSVSAAARALVAAARC